VQCEKAICENVFQGGGVKNHNILGKFIEKKSLRRKNTTRGGGGGELTKPSQGVTNSEERAKPRPTKGGCKGGGVGEKKLDNAQIIRGNPAVGNHRGELKNFDRNGGPELRKHKNMGHGPPLPGKNKYLSTGKLQYPKIVPAVQGENRICGVTKKESEKERREEKVKTKPSNGTHEQPKDWNRGLVSQKRGVQTGPPNQMEPTLENHSN